MRKLFGKKKNGKFNRKIKNEPVWWRILKKQATEFCLATGLHGYKYIAQSQRSKTERIIWAIAVFVALSCSIVLMKLAWNYYVAHPILTVIESTHHGIWNYPFPAVTVCNINRVSLKLTENFVQKLKVPSNVSKELLIEDMRLLNELINPGIFEDDITKNLTRLQNIFDYNDISIPEAVHAVTENCSTLMKACKWKGERGSCDRLFKQTLSRDGFCCSFNNFVSSDANNLEEEPYRLTSCGYQTGLNLLIYVDTDDYHATTFGAYGVKVIIHDPYDYPDYNAEYKLVGLGKQVFLSVTPEETYSTPAVKKLKISTRNCIFDEEKDQINFGKMGQVDMNLAKYSYLNCMLKCRAITIKEKCNCIPYYYPQNGTRVCNFSDDQCLKLHFSLYESSWPGIELTRALLSASSVEIEKRPCGCVPDCILYKFPVESSQSDLDLTAYHSEVFTRIIRNKTKNYSTIHVFFSDLVSIQYRRNIHYNWRNLFASFGGLLGLFAGFSLMSVFELIYFFVIRVITDMCCVKKTYASSK